MWLQFGNKLRRVWTLVCAFVLYSMVHVLTTLRLGNLSHSSKRWWKDLENDRCLRKQVRTSKWAEKRNSKVIIFHRLLYPPSTRSTKKNQVFLCLSNDCILVENRSYRPFWPTLPRRRWSLGEAQHDTRHVIQCKYPLQSRHLHQSHGNSGPSKLGAPTLNY